MNKIYNIYAQKKGPYYYDEDESFALGTYLDEDKACSEAFKLQRAYDEKKEYIIKSYAERLCTLYEDENIEASSQELTDDILRVKDLVFKVAEMRVF